jgi:branched-chain amino acid transport system ATP-binding protein
VTSAREAPRGPETANAAPAPAQPVLQLANITAGYGRSTVLRDVSVEIPSGSIVALLGPNGAGKTTLLRTAAGLLRPAAGTVRLNGAEVTKAPPHHRARGGLCLIPEGRGIFRNLTVRENLRMQVPRGAKGAAAGGLDRVLVTFPVLRERLGQTAGTMSGGEQQLLALARCYLTSPRVVLLDEVSMGLAPKMVDEIFAAIVSLAAGGAALVLVEQYVNRALELASTAVLLDRGTIAYNGQTRDLDEAAVLRGYLGVDVAGMQAPPAIPRGLPAALPSRMYPRDAPSAPAR